MATIQCNEFLIYQHIRVDTDKIFYIGIGNKKRPYSKVGRNNYWNKITNKTDYHIEIIKDNLTWKQAQKLEISLIKKYGRVNNKTGILCNMTDGGEGRNNSKHSKLTLLKLRNAKLGKKLSKSTKNIMSINSYKSKKVIDLSTNIIYSSATEVSKIFNIPQGTLRHYLCGTRTNKTNFKYL
jgi:hypothetical protein